MHKIVPVIGIAGPAGHGKDTLGNMLVYLLNEYEQDYQHWFDYRNKRDFSENPNKWEIKKFAARLKDTAEALGRFRKGAFEYKEVKDYTIQFAGEKVMSGRMFLVTLARSIKQTFGKTVWCDLLFEDFSHTKSHWVVTDLRFTYEKEVIEKLNGITIYIFDQRKEEETYKETEDFLTERSNYTITVNNDGTLEDLFNAAITIVNSFKHDWFEDKKL